MTDMEASPPAVSSQLPHEVVVMVLLLIVVCYYASVSCRMPSLALVGMWCVKV